ncbi:hypothetical protein HX793_27785 [Pseudomonas reactans]|uniref:hypothetical protein n=1 Tax=Pseudomonas reactans TaxID=117680 RepID=UPI00159FA41F|nr:hypothetical protein [Pseudomonas reactans]NWC85123.1 hypothetical protein [Pseudomonas reactans]NWD33595.1 hypothetical protein [Pseudomonas reactans]
MSTIASTRTDATPQPAQLNETSLTSTSRPLESLSDQALTKKILELAPALDPWGNEFFTLHTADRMAKGTQENGEPATQEQIETMKEFLARPDLYKHLDLQPPGGIEDGQINLDSVAVEAGEISQVSDRKLIQLAKDFHTTYDTTGNGYVNYNELRKAEDSDIPELAKKVARELLARPELLKQLDIGVGFLGFAGKDDERYDVTNLDYMIKNSSKRVNYPFRSKTV